MQQTFLYAFNRGKISPLALSRLDLKRASLSAETQVNFIPRALGSMMLRPGRAYVGSTLNDQKARHLKFIYSSTDRALIELTANLMRVRLESGIITRPSVTTAITNPNFDSSLTGWTDADDPTTVSDWSSGYMRMIGNQFSAAKRYQTVTVSGGNIGVRHALRISIPRGEVHVQVGSGVGYSDYVAETTLKAGGHSLSFVPTGDFTIYFSCYTEYYSFVNSCNIEAAGDFTLPTPWAESDLPNIRYIQSLDVLFVACKGYRQYRIERRGTYSWSIIKYMPKDGPFMAMNLEPITIIPSALKGECTLTASKPLFDPSHVGALFKLESAGQLVQETFTAHGQYTDEIRVTGIGSGRAFWIDVRGTFVATVWLQRSVGAVGAWTDVESYTGFTAKEYRDGFDNQIIYYRLGIKSGGYTSGSVNAYLQYNGGVDTGIAEVFYFGTSYSVSAIIHEPFGSLNATSSWWEGVWSDKRGFPTAVTIDGGRLVWTGKDRFIASSSDAYESFDSEIEGDSGPINRSIGYGAVDSINWVVPSQRLTLGGDLNVHFVYSSSLDEPLTPTNTNIKAPYTQGAAAIDAIKKDGDVIFVGASKTNILSRRFNNLSMDYEGDDLTKFCPEIGEPEIVQIEIQYQPDVRIHARRSDGTVFMVVYDKAENLQCLVDLEMEGFVEDIIIYQNQTEDVVQYCVRYTVGGVTKRYLETWAKESECIGGAINKQADCFVTYSGTPTTVVTATHLAGKEVVVWGDGKNIGKFTLNVYGSVSIPVAVSNYIVGLPYEARFKSSKLSQVFPDGTTMLMKKNLRRLGLALSNTHYRGIKYGQSFSDLRDLPTIERGNVVAEDYIWGLYDNETIAFPGTWDTDARLCLKAEAPNPCTVTAAIVEIDVHG